MSQRKICASAIEELQRELGGAPERYRDEFNQKEAVRVLFPEIRAMQSKGYSVAEIAQLLSDRGVEVRASSLRTLLSIFRCAAEKSRVHRALKARKETASATRIAAVDQRSLLAKRPPERSGDRAATAAAVQRRETPTMPAHGAQKPPATSGSSQRLSTAASSERVARPGTFIPREDTDDI